MNDKIHGGIRRAGRLPRTLIGVNGVRLINIPGVYHPPHMLTAKTQRERHLPVILSKPPRLGYLQPTGGGFSFVRYHGWMEKKSN